MSRVIHRSAVTGRLVTAEFAASNPDQTVAETLDTPSKTATVVQEHLDEVKAHLAAVQALVEDLRR